MEGCAEGCMEVHGGAQRCAEGVQRCAEGCAEVCGGARGYAEVHGGAQRGACPSLPLVAPSNHRFSG